MRSLGLLTAATVFCAAAACSDDSGTSCDADHRLVDGTCVGVTRPEICKDTYCTAGASCATTYYVKAGGGGDGSKSSPFADLPRAAAKAKAGDCIALAQGSYSAASVEGGVSILGSGADRVTVTGTAAQSALSVVQGSGGRVRGLAIDSVSVGLVIQETKGLEVEQVRISAATGQGLDARQVQSLKLLHVEVRKVDTAGGADAGTDATLADAGPDATTSPDAGVPDLQVQPDASAGDAGQADAAPDLSPADQGAPDAGTPDVGPDAAIADDAGASVDAVASASGGSEYGIGILVASGSTAVIERCLVRQAGTQGILIHGSSATVKQSRVSGSGFYGVAIDCTAGCKSLPASEVLGSTLDSNKAIGLLAMGGKIVARDNDIGGTVLRSNFAGYFARNVQLQSHVELTFERNRVHGCEGQGLVIDESTGTVKDNTVQDNGDRGAVLQSAQKLTFEDNVFERNEQVGIATIGSTGVTIKGGRVTDTKKKIVLVGAGSAWVGDGVQLLDKSEVTIHETRLENNERIGVLFDDALATSEVADTSISGSEDPLVIQNATLGEPKLSGITDAAGKGINATKPATPYVNDKASLPKANLAGTLPLPLP